MPRDNAPGPALPAGGSTYCSSDTRLEQVAMYVARIATSLACCGRHADDSRMAVDLLPPGHRQAAINAAPEQRGRVDDPL